MILGLVAAKAGSKRFPGKNRHPYQGAPLFWHAVQPLLDAQLVDEVRVVTDDPAIRDYTWHHRGVRPIEVIHHPHHAIDNHTAHIHDVWRYAYQVADLEVEMVVTILANCPGHCGLQVDQVIGMMRSENFWQVLSYGPDGAESGLRVMARHVIQAPVSEGCKLGSVHDEAFEVHHREDME